MKSRITIDTHTNEDGVMKPVIRLDFKNSDDVRDKLIKSLLNQKGYSGILGIACSREETTCYPEEDRSYFISAEINDTLYNGRDLVSFGEYLLSKERKSMFRSEPAEPDMLPVEVRLEMVHHADMENWKERRKNQKLSSLQQ